MGQIEVIGSVAVLYSTREIILIYINKKESSRNEILVYDSCQENHELESE